MTQPTARVRRRTWLRWPRRTARLRLTGVYGSLFLVSGGTLVAITYGLFERATKFEVPPLPSVPHAPAIQDLEQPLKALGVAPATGSFTKALPQLGRLQALLTSYERQLVAPKAAAVSVPQGGSALKLPVSLLTQDQHELVRDQHRLAGTVHQLAEAVHQVAQAGSVEAAQRAADSHQLLVDAGIALAVVAALAVLTGWLIAGRVLRPIRTITRTARRISSASLHERLALEGPSDELKELGDTLDDLFGRLDAAFQAQRHFVANASHELRTPLTAERNLLQVALDDPDTSADTWRTTAEELLASNDEQSHLIDALLTLASSERGLDHREPVDLSTVVDTVLLERGEPDGLGPTIDKVVDTAWVDGEPRLLESLVANLVDNAVTYNVEGGRVVVSTGTEDGKAMLEVTNSGPVVPPADVDRLFQPFQRLDPHRIHHHKGHGLGLSIVRAIATAHGAAITVRPEPVGGLKIEVAFPARARRGPGALDTSGMLTRAV
jgi:signal transduction histidine kinase